MDTTQNEFNGWARVEVMGHQTHIGYVTTQTFGQAVMFRIDQPALPGCEEPLKRPEHVTRGDSTIYAPAGSIVKREDIPAATVLVGAGSIYRIIPCDEAAAMKAIRADVRPPLMLVRLGDSNQIAAAVERDDDDDDDDEEEYLESLENMSARGY